MAKKQSVASKMKAAQEELKKKISNKAEEAKTVRKAKTAKEQYKELRTSIKEKNAPKEIAFKDNYEEELIKELFKDQITVPQLLGNEEEEKPEVPKRERTGTWDYVLEDEITFFDPECSYELTGYKLIDETHGLDFNPDWFTEAGRIYTETGKYTEYPQGSKPYNDYWLEQLNRCTNGYTVNGYRVTPDHYFFLNFYRMNIVDDSKKAASGSEEGFPKFLAEQYKFFHYFEMCEYLKKDIVALKSRGINDCATI